MNIATELEDHVAKLRDQLHKDTKRLRRFARMLTGNQKWADQCVDQLLEDLLLAPRLFNPASSPKVALYSRLLRILSAVPEESLLPHSQLETSASRQAQLLTTVEEFSRDEAREILSVDGDQIDELLHRAQLELARQHGARILIVEDEAFIAMELEFLVDDMGHEYLDTASTQTEAVDKALLLKPDLILSDLQLSDGGSGVEAAQDISNTMDVSSVFVTSNAEQLLTAQKPEPLFIISKPFKRDAVQSVISQALLFRSQRTMSVPL